MSDALFGVDGTELPPLAPDPSGRGRWRDSSALPPLPLPHLPDVNTTREAVAAALDPDPGGPLDSDPTAVPASPPPSVPPVSAAAGSAAVPAPAPPASDAGRASPAAPSRPVITASASPAQPGRGGARSLPRSALAAGSFPRVYLRDPRRRLSRLGRSLPTQSRSNGGAGAFFMIMSIVFAVLLYFIINGLVESFASLIRLMP